MREHIRILGILNIVMGCFVALIGIAVLMVMGGVAGAIGVSVGYSNDANGFAVAPVIAFVGLCIAIFFLVLALPSIIGGWGLLSFRPWARILIIIVSVFHLFHVPIGTALGVYGLWALLSDDARRLFETGGQMGIQPVYPAQPQGVYQQPPVYPPQTPPGV